MLDSILGSGRYRAGEQSLMAETTEEALRMTVSHIYFSIIICAFWNTSLFLPDFREDVEHNSHAFVVLCKIQEKVSGVMQKE